MYPLKEVSLPIELPPLEEVMIWHPRFERDTGHERWRGVVKDVAASLVSPPADSAAR